MPGDIEVRREKRQRVETDDDVVLARSLAEDIAGQAGFDTDVGAEIGIVAAELAENVRKHAEHGELTVSHMADDADSGIRIESRDAGSGIEDIENAFTDGVSTAGSLGRGLGAVNRLMDRVSVMSPGTPGNGTHVTADRWVRSFAEPTVDPLLTFGAASRPKVLGTENGDSFVLTRWNDTTLVGVIDGLGHGPPAHTAAMAAKGYVNTHADRPLGEIFAGTERACKATRGVVMALARFDWTAQTVTFGAVGNITHKTDGIDLRVVDRRGVLGSNGPDPVVASADLVPETRLVLASDGVDSRWQLSDYERILADAPTVAARRLLAELGKDHDDATVLVGLPADGPGSETETDQRENHQ
mgnify:FL=1